MTTDPATFTRLPNLISAPRLKTYTQNTTSPAEALRLYTWNVEVSSAMWSELNAFEVILRNTIHETLSSGFGRGDWWNDPRVVFNHPGSDQITQAKTDAARAAGRNHRSSLPEDVVAALSFGFWTSLIGLGGAEQYETKFWQPHLRKAFPRYTGTRGQLSKDLETIRLLRNRIAHHEPIFGRHLWGDHLRIARIAGYIDLDAKAYIDSQSRMDSVLNKRGGCVRLGVDTSF